MGLEMEAVEEGCLSLPGYRGEVERHARVTVRGKNRRGKERTIEAEGLLARCFQHELDHLDGILLIERLDDDQRRAAKRLLRERRLDLGSGDPDGLGRLTSA